MRQVKPLLATASRLGLSLLPARAIQALAGTASIWAIGRAVGLAGLGEVLATVAAVGMATGLIAAALSDYALATPRGAEIRFSPYVWRSAYVTGTLATVALLSDVATVWIIALFAVASLAAALDGALRLAQARRMSNTGRIGTSWTLSAALTVTIHLAFVGANVGDWRAYLLGYLPTMLAPLLLPRLGPASDHHAAVSLDVRTGFFELMAFATSQGSWVVMGQAPILISRLILTPEAAGTIGVAIRITETAAVLLPIMGLMVLPIFGHYGRNSEPIHKHKELNDRIALIGVGWILCVGPLGWLLWLLLVPEAAFPSSTYLIVLSGEVFSAAFGMPDRILQSTRRARVVGRWGVIAASSSVGFCLLFGFMFGINGAAAGRVVGSIIANVGPTFSLYHTFRRLAPYFASAFLAVAFAAAATLALPGHLWRSIVWALCFGLLFLRSIARLDLPDIAGGSASPSARRE
jgi:O-antigen/teichoic acid export membrane protein